MNKASLGQVLSRFYGEYMKSTPKRLKIVDAYLFYILLTGIVQFVYCCLVGSFPFNSFLSGFISTVSCFVLAGMFNKTNTVCHIPNVDIICYSLSSIASESWEQEPILWNQPWTWIRRLYFRTHHSPHYCHQFYWLNDEESGHKIPVCMAK